MAQYFPKQSGTTVTSFQIGSGTGKTPFTIDASGISTPTTWTIPSGNGSAGNVLTNDGFGGLSWASAGSASVSGVIIGDTICGLLGSVITAKVSFGNAADIPYSTINLGTV